MASLFLAFLMGSVSSFGDQGVEFPAGTRFKDLPTMAQLISSKSGDVALIEVNQKIYLVNKVESSTTGLKIIANELENPETTLDLLISNGDEQVQNIQIENKSGTAEAQFRKLSLSGLNAASFASLDSLRPLCSSILKILEIRIPVPEGASTYGD